MHKVQIQCPACTKIGFIEVEDNLISESQRGVAAVNVSEHLVCEHSFVAYIDRNFMVRDCFITDFRIELPQIEIKSTGETVSIPDINIYLIMINVRALTLAYLLRCSMYKKKACIITDLDVVKSEILKLVQYVFQNTFDFKLDFVTRSEYKKEKKKYKESIVIENEKVLNDKDKLMNPKDIKIESAVVQKFLAEPDDTSSIIILKSEVDKAYHLSAEIKDFLKSHDSNIRLSPELLNGAIGEKFGTPVNNAYLKFLLRVSKYYFQTDIAEYLDFFDHLQWLYFIK